MRSPARWTPALLVSMAWMAVIALAVPNLAQNARVVVALAGVLAALLTFGIWAWSDHARWRLPVRALTRLTRSLREERKLGQAVALPPVTELAELTREIAALARLERPRAIAERPAARTSLGDLGERLNRFTYSERPLRCAA